MPYLFIVGIDADVGEVRRQTSKAALAVSACAQTLGLRVHPVHFLHRVVERLLRYLHNKREHWKSYTKLEPRNWITEDRVVFIGK